MYRIQSSLTLCVSFAILGVLAGPLGARTRVLAAPTARHLEGAAPSSVTRSYIAKPGQLAQVKFIYRGLGVRPPHQKSKKGKMLMPLFNQYLLQTGKNQKATIGFADGTTLHINQQTDALLRSPHVTYVKKGEVNELLAPGTNHRVATASAVAAALGTDFDVKVQGKKTSFIVVHGLVTVTNAKGTTEVKPNQQTVVLANKAPSPPQAVDAAAKVQWTARLPQTSPGENVALSANGAQIVDYSSEQSGHSVNNIIDGLVNTAWESASGKPANQWVKLQLGGGQTYLISQVSIDPGAPAGVPSSADLQNFEIRASTTGSDDADFRTVFVGVCQQSNTLQTFPFALPLKAKYVELFVKDNFGNPSFTAVSEFEVVGLTSAQVVNPWRVLSSSDLFHTAWDVAVDQHDDVYVADAQNDRVVKLSPTGQMLAAWTGPTNSLRFADPEGVRVDDQGDIFVADAGNNRVFELSPSGRLLATFGSNGGAMQFNSPQSVATDSQGNIYVADTHNNRVVKVARNGQLLGAWGSLGNGPGQFNQPEYVTIDPKGNIFVVDTGNNRVVKLSPAGLVLATYASSKSGSLHFNTPQGVTVDRQGNIYVADGHSNRIVKLSADDRLLASWGSFGGQPGQFNDPRGITLDSAGTLYVADSANNRIQALSADDQSR